MIAGSRQEGQLETLRRVAVDEGLKIDCLSLDVTEGESLNLFAQFVRDKFAKVDLLISNAAVAGPIGSLNLASAESLRTAFETNVIGVMETVRVFTDLMHNSGDARLIVLSGGGVGGSNPMRNAPAYAASKAAVCVFVETIAEELLRNGITAVALAPGNIPTSFLDGVLEVGPSIAGEDLYLEVKARDSSLIRDAMQPLVTMIDYLAEGDVRFLAGGLLSARWNSPASLEEVRKSGISTDRFKLRRIDAELFFEIGG